MSRIRLLRGRPALLLVTLVALLVSSCSLPPERPCPYRLDEDTLSRLTLSLPPTLEMRPGQARTLSLGVVECCTYLDPVDTCVTWSVEPPTGATIGAGGELSIDASVPGGSVFCVTANVESGRQQVSIDVVVYATDQASLGGSWGEQAQVDCASGKSRPPSRSGSCASLPMAAG